eukprot:6175751-Pleurochrysis_carterae.AAC.3
MSRERLELSRRGVYSYVLGLSIKSPDHCPVASLCLAVVPLFLREWGGGNADTRDRRAYFPEEWVRVKPGLH